MPLGLGRRLRNDPRQLSPPKSVLNLFRVSRLLGLSVDHWCRSNLLRLIAGYYKRNKCCYVVIASDQRERGNLPCLPCITERLLRRLAPRNDTPFIAFVLVSC